VEKIKTNERREKEDSSRDYRRSVGNDGQLQLKQKKAKEVKKGEKKLGGGGIKSKRE
jgi:hypothetical protein